MDDNFCAKCGRPMDLPVTRVHVVLDKSGSMENVRETTISGFNEYVQTLRRTKKAGFRVSFTLFDTSVEKVYVDSNLEDVKMLTKETYAPDGGTALYDAVCMTIKDAMPLEGKHLMVIMTDGYENASKEYNRETLKALIKTAEATGKWEFVFMGADLKAVADAKDWGIATGNTAFYNNTNMGTGMAFTMAANNTRAYATSSTTSTGGGAAGAFFSPDDKQTLINAQ